MREWNNGKVTGAFELDFDRTVLCTAHHGRLEVLHHEGHLHTIFHADRKDYISRAARWERFEQTDGKGTALQAAGTTRRVHRGTRRLRPDEVMFRTK